MVENSGSGGLSRRKSWSSMVAHITNTAGPSPVFTLNTKKLRNTWEELVAFPNARWPRSLELDRCRRFSHALAKRLSWEQLAAFQTVARGGSFELDRFSLRSLRYSVACRTTGMAAGKASMTYWTPSSLKRDARPLSMKTKAGERMSSTMSTNWPGPDLVAETVH